MKTRIVIIVGVVLATLEVSAQEWIGSRFTLDTIVAIEGAHIPESPNQIKCKMVDKTFYFVEQQSFQHRRNGHQAVIHAFSTDNYEQTEILLPLPDNGRNRERYARSLWINDFSFNGDHLLVTTQEELILYKRIHNQNYQVVSTYRHHNLCMGYLHRNKINFFEEDHDQGFKWFQQDLGSDSATLVRELPYEAPHTVQIYPNRYLSHNHQSVFFLSTRFPRIEVYDLDGHARDTVRFDLAPWKAFGDDYIRQTLAVPYGIERIYAVKDHIYDYSYLKVAMPLRGDLLLLYMQFDTLTGKSALQYAIRNEDGLTNRYLRNIHEDSVYHAARFPFTLFIGGYDKGNASGDDIIVQLTYKTEVSWQGKSHAEYQRALNDYFEGGEPALAYKIMRYTPQQRGEATLFTTSGRRLSLSEMPLGKSVLLLHQDLECSGCVKAIYRLIGQTEFPDIHIGQVYPREINGFSAYELNSTIRKETDKPFKLYYDTSANYKDLTSLSDLKHSDFPCVMLVQKGERPQLFKAGDLFTQDYQVAELNETFLEAWKSFISEESVP